jgi:hypothetical protein
MRDWESFRLMTAVRDPIGRIVSSYRHILREPRDRLHRAALQMPPDQFFSNFGDVFANHQLRYLEHALLEFPRTILVRGEYNRWQMAHFWETVDRFDWIVPMEAIDEFSALWSIETGRVLSQASTTINVAPKDAINAKVVAEVVAGMPDLYALDLELWNVARKGFSDFRTRVVLADRSPATDANLAWRAGNSAIWLTRDWYPALTHGDGSAEWWAGPAHTSQIVVQRDRSDATLAFDIVVMIGLRPQNIHVYLAPDRRLPVTLQEVPAGTRLHVDTSSLPEGRSTLLVSVPEVYSPNQFSETDADTSRKSFSTKSWHFVGK